MNAFISYSIGENEEYFLTLLAQKLAGNSITLVTSYNQSDFPDFQTVNDIKNCAFFIGLITTSGRPPRTERVYQELGHANQYHKLAILLVEDTVNVDPWVTNHPNTFRFNRHNPHNAIETVDARIKLSQSAGLQQNGSNAAAWILGGIAALALLSLLSEKK
jgi:hypothetical protein